MTKENATLPPESQLRKLAQGLLAKTTQGQVNWAWDSDGQRYEVNLPESSIHLWYTEPRLQPDSITLAFRNSRGLLVGALSAMKPEPDAEAPDVSPDWPLLEKLYAEVHRSATGWDKVVNEIETALASIEPIG